MTSDEERYVDCDKCGERFVGEAIIRQYMTDRGRGDWCIACAVSRGDWTIAPQEDPA